MNKPPGEREMNRWWVQWLAKRTPSCQKASELASQALERPLSLSERVALRLHFLICACCKRYVVQLRLLRWMIRQSIRRLEEPGSPVDVVLAPEARERIKRAVR